MTPPRLLAVIGSGETAPTMTTVHAELLERAGPGLAVMLDTPFGFQENADEIAAKARAYFHDNVGRDIEVASFRDAGTASAVAYEQMCARLAQAVWAFAGPGSPTYALRQWRDTRVPELLADKLSTGGVVVFSSAAAVGLGEVALPVYEIYKVGEPPRWVEGLDLLRHAGVRAAVIPHFNNAEGGTHDTRYCYMGARRLAELEAQLPAGCGILGVDEHTACIIDVAAGTLGVRGRGRVTWRRDGAEVQWGGGEELTIAELSSGRAGGHPGVAETHTPTPAQVVSGAASPFMEEVGAERDAAVTALGARDPDGALAAILAVESAIHQWSRDSLQSDEPDRARQVLRELVVRLAELARMGSLDARERVAPLVDAVLALREQARGAGRFEEADRLRAAITGVGVEIRDSPEGTSWDLREGAAVR